MEKSLVLVGNLMINLIIKVKLVCLGGKFRI